MQGGGARDGALVTTRGGVGPDPFPGDEPVIPIVSKGISGSTTSTSYVFSGAPRTYFPPVRINGSEMMAGVDYLVMATSTLAMGNSTTIGDIKLVVDRNTSSAVCQLRYRGVASTVPH